MDNFRQFHDKLNSKQREAVDYISGPLLILAGPGTGKTELLSVRAANIIRQKKACPENILILTYTNAAAKAMKERLIKILGNLAYNIETATFHSFANTVILESEEAAEYIQERVQLTDIEQIKLLEYILDNTEGIDAIRPFRARYAYEKDIMSCITDLKREGISPCDFEKIIAKTVSDGTYIEDKHIPRLVALAVVYKLYEEYKAGKNPDLFDERGRYDYDDMILLAIEVLRGEARLKESMRRQYTHIMVDEFQDTNGAQMNFLFELTGKDCLSLCCVGDDDQSIFRFQGASVANFRELKKRFPEINEISLKKNYRSTKEIIELSGKIIDILPEIERVRAKELEPENDYKKKKIDFKEFTTETEELLFIAKKIKELKDIPLEEIAVLVRQRDDILKIVDVFLRAGIAYATDGKEDIAGEKRVRQMLDVLNFAHMKDVTDYSEKDAVLYRILTSDYFCIPMNDVLRLIASVRAKNLALRKEGKPPITLFDEFMRAEGKGPIFHAREVLGSLLNESEVKPVHAMLMRYIKDAGVDEYILKAYQDNSLLRIRDLRALTSFVNMVKASDIARPGIALAEFLDEIETKKAHGLALTGNLVTATQEGVRIFTVHGSKGLEFHTVFIPFCLEKKRWPKKPLPVMIPLPPEVYKSKESPAGKEILKQLNYYDETRLFYVASTRAKANLIYTASPTESVVGSSYLSMAGLDTSGVQEAAQGQAKEEDILISSLELTDNRDPFIGTDKVLSDIVANLSLNPTSLNNYINCPRKYLYDDVLMLPSEKKQSMVFGNCVHKALEEAYDEFMNSEKFPSFNFFRDAFIRELNHQGPEDAIRTACLRQAETLKGWFKRESSLPVKPLGLEKRLAATLDDGLLFTGKYDKTESAGEGAVRVIDYKTGVPDEHVKNITNSLSEGIPVASDEFEDYLRQLISYKLLFDSDKIASKGRRVVEGKLVFTEPARKTVLKYGLEEGEYVNCPVKITQEMVCELEAAIKDIWKRIKRLEFSRLPKADIKPGRCGSGRYKCDFYDICWG